MKVQVDSNFKQPKMKLQVVFNFKESGTKLQVISNFNLVNNKATSSFQLQTSLEWIYKLFTTSIESIMKLQVVSGLKRVKNETKSCSIFEQPKMELQVGFNFKRVRMKLQVVSNFNRCLLYTSDAADICSV